MDREIVKIDRDKCNGCGNCIPNCHEGALQMIDGKATLVSELMCDGLGACLGECPLGAIEIEVREAEPYDEVKVMKEISSFGKNIVIAHLNHLKEHDEMEFLRQGVAFLRENKDKLKFEFEDVLNAVHYHTQKSIHLKQAVSTPEVVNSTTHKEVGCPGSQSRTFAAPLVDKRESEPMSTSSQLMQWPIQMHLINPGASHFQKSDLLLAADCIAYSIGNFHQQFLKGKTLAIACPKLDGNKEIYVEKLIRLIDDSKINTITVMKMEVPCCGGLLQLAKMAMEQSSRKVPIKSITIGIQGEILDEIWV
jgi:NAD-dependent dihydropyrimidine dehydrogenase PreA subunit